MGGKNSVIPQCVLNLEGFAGCSFREEDFGPAELASKTGWTLADNPNFNVRTALAPGAA
jgi:hypothetical protein